MTTPGATSEVQPSLHYALDAGVTFGVHQREEGALPISAQIYEVSLDLSGDPFEPDPAVRAEIWCEHEEMRELDDPPSCDLGPPLTRGDLR